MVARAMLMLLAVFTISAGRARANDGPNRVEAARILFERGTEHAAHGRFADAERSFEASLALVPRANTQYNLAVVLYRQQRFAGCLRALDSFLDRTDPVRDAPIRRNALSLHGIASRHAARISIRVMPANAIVSGADFAGAGVNRRAYLDSGTHRVTVSAPLHDPRTVEIEALPGRPLTIALTLQRSGERSEPVVGEDARRSVAPWSLVLGGGALLAGAAVTGLLALDADEHVTRSCPAGGPPCERLGLRTTRSYARTLAATTDVLWVTGAISTSVGLGWLLFAKDMEPERRATLVAPTSGGATVAF